MKRVRDDAVRLAIGKVRELSLSSLLACGASELHASAITEMLVAAERDGCSSHGLFRLPSFLEGCTGGLVDTTAEPQVSAILPGAVRVDARGGFTQAAEAAGMPLLARKAREQGVAVMGVVNARGMSGAMWYPAERLAEQGLVSIVCCNTPGYVSAAVGSARRVFGTNPMAFGWPRDGGKPPFVWDQSSSVMARGEVQVHLRDGLPIPDGVGVDRNGNATADAAEILAGAQLPFGRYKGANLAAMIELLSAALFGSDLAVDRPDGSAFETYSRGLFVLAIDPTNLRQPDAPGSAASHGERLFTALLGGQEEGASHSSCSSRLAGDRRREHRARVGEGQLIEIPASLHETITKLVASHQQAKRGGGGSAC